MTEKGADIHTRVANETRDELERLAADDGRKLSAYVRRVLELHIEEKKKQGAKRR